MGAIPELLEPQQLALRKCGQWAVYRDDQADRPLPRIVYPGAFHPLHAGHRRIAEIASARLTAPVEFEISLLNVDKPRLSYQEVERRIGQFSADATIWLTQTPTFAEKSRLFPNSVFLVGADTLFRIVDQRYYGNDPNALDAAIREVTANNCRFLVFGRQVGQQFWTLQDIAIPVELRKRCEGVAAEEFRMDVSSTVLRRQADNPYDR